MVLSIRSLRMCEIVLNNYLGMGKLCAGYVPRTGTIDHKRKRVHNCGRNIASPQHNKDQLNSGANKAKDVSVSKQNHWGRLHWAKEVFLQIIQFLLRCIVALTKFKELGYELPYSHTLRIWPSEIISWSKLEKWIRRKRFCSNNEIITEKKANFKELDKSYYLEVVKNLSRTHPRMERLYSDWKSM